MKKIFLLSAIILLVSTLAWGLWHDEYPVSVTGDMADRIMVYDDSLGTTTVQTKTVFLSDIDPLLGTDTNNTLGALTRTATHVRMGTGAAMVTLTNIVASGTSALGTGAISSATCATVVTTSATGAATTDVIGWGFNGDPTAVTGYVPLTTGMLTIIAYPTANNVNYKVCNNTASSITPGAITLNWRIDR